MPEKEVVARRFIELLIELAKKAVVLVPVPPDCQASALSAFNSPFLSGRREYRSRRSAAKSDASCLPAGPHEAEDSFSDRRMRRAALEGRGCLYQWRLRVVPLDRPDVTEIGADTRYTTRRFLMTAADCSGEKDERLSFSSKCEVTSVIRPNLTLETPVLPE